MAIELRSENPGQVVSPRISFSHDLSKSDVVPIEPYLFPSNTSGIDFNFSISDSNDHESSSADDLFSDGKLLPTQIKTKILPPNQTQQQEQNSENSKGEVLKSDEKQSTKSFWGFKRSSSLKCGGGGGGYARSLCPLPLLSRSQSTGSAASSKRSSSSGFSKQNSQRNSFSASSKSQMTPPSGSNYQKPPLKKGYGNYGKCVQVNPVLNVPSGNLFGLGSIFSNGKDKNKKK